MTLECQCYFNGDLIYRKYFAGTKIDVWNRASAFMAEGFAMITDEDHLGNLMTTNFRLVQVSDENLDPDYFEGF